LEDSVFGKVKVAGNHVVGQALTRRATKQFIFYQEATQYWVKATVGLPYYAKNGEVGPPAHGRYLYFDNALGADAICALLNSSLFYTYFIAYGDCFHLSDNLAASFPLPNELPQDSHLVELSNQLMRDLEGNAQRKTIRTLSGDQIAYAEFYGSLSKSIIDEIDRVLAQHYGFTAEELDFIINYDIKYRMGRDAEEEGEDE